MKGKELKKKFPEWAKKNNIQDDDIVYLAGDKIKVLRSS